MDNSQCGNTSRLIVNLELRNDTDFTFSVRFLFLHSPLPSFILHFFSIPSAYVFYQFDGQSFQLNNSLVVTSGDHTVSIKDNYGCRQNFNTRVDPTDSMSYELWVYAICGGCVACVVCE